MQLRRGHIHNQSYINQFTNNPTYPNYFNPVQYNQNPSSFLGNQTYPNYFSPGQYDQNSNMFNQNGQNFQDNTGFFNSISNFMNQILGLMRDMFNQMYGNKNANNNPLIDNRSNQCNNNGHSNQCNNNNGQSNQYNNNVGQSNQYNNNVGQSNQSNNNVGQNNQNIFNGNQNNPQVNGNNYQQKSVNPNEAGRINDVKGLVDKGFNLNTQLDLMKGSVNTNAGAVYRGTSYAGYFQQPTIDGLTSLYQATGDKKYIDQALKLANTFKDLGKDINGDGYKEWTSGWVKKGYNHSHPDWRAGSGISTLAAEIMTNPKLAEYKQQGTELTNLVAKDIFEKYTKIKGEANGGVEDADVAHFIGRTGTMALNLYKITGDNKYLDFVQRKGKELKNNLKVNGKGAYEWSGDTSHAGDAVNFMVEAYKAGVVFDKTDMQRLSNTVKNNLWNGSTSNPQFKENIDGSGNYGGNGNAQGGWIKLAEFDPKLRDIYYNWIRTQKTDADGMQEYGNLARSLAYGTNLF